MNNSTVSIIIPCYNGERFINRCVDSLLSQTYRNLEVIIINDGSKDKSEKFIKLRENELREEGIRFIYINQKNRGPGGAINTGLKYVSGEYLTLLDVDDYIMPKSIELRVDFLEKNNDYDIVRANGYYVTENNLEDKSRLFVINDSEKNNENIFDDLIQAKTNNWAGSYMIRTNKLFDFYKDRNIFESRYGQNLQLLLPVAYKGKSGFIDEPMVKYIRQEESLSQLNGDMDFDIKNMLGYKEIRRHMVDILLIDDEKKKYLDMIEITYSRYFMNLAVEYKNKSLLEKNYKDLKEYNVQTIDDKIIYYKAKNKYICIILRIIRKLTFKRGSND